ncbi:hypothetical protein Tco_1321259 [Tanacetum coccineum]
MECNQSLPEGVPFVNNMVIEEPKYRIFFTDILGDQAFQRWNDIHKKLQSKRVKFEAASHSLSCLQDAQAESTRKNLAFSEAVLSE